MNTLRFVCDSVCFHVIIIVFDENRYFFSVETLHLLVLMLLKRYFLVLASVRFDILYMMIDRWYMQKIERMNCVISARNHQSEKEGRQFLSIRRMSKQIKLKHISRNPKEKAEGKIKDCAIYPHPTILSLVLIDHVTFCVYVGHCVYNNTEPELDVQCIHFMYLSNDALFEQIWRMEQMKKRRKTRWLQSINMTSK